MRIASILIGLSCGDGRAQDAATMVSNESRATSASTAATTSFSASLTMGKRKRFLSLDGEESTPSPMELDIKGSITLVGGNNGHNDKTCMNWKTGVYFDEDGRRMQLTIGELKALRSVTIGVASACLYVVIET